jgi:hypothetical protein
MTVTASEISTEPVLNSLGQEACDQIRQLVDVVVHDGIESTPDAREV